MSGKKERIHKIQKKANLKIKNSKKQKKIFRLKLKMFTLKRIIIKNKKSKYI